jgi:hypothetical protein
MKEEQVHEPNISTGVLNEQDKLGSEQDDLVLVIEKLEQFALNNEVKEENITIPTKKQNDAPVVIYPDPVGVYCSLQEPVVGIHIGSIYKFTLNEAMLCYRMGKQRQENNVKNKSLDRNLSDRSGQDIHVQGILGEYAFCKLFNLPISICDTVCRNTLNDSFDARISCGINSSCSIDVKTTCNKKGDLVVGTWKKSNPADLYVLMIWINYTCPRNKNSNENMITEKSLAKSVPVLCFKGYARNTEVFQNKHMSSFGRTKKNNLSYSIDNRRYCVEQDKLKELEQVLCDIELQDIMKESTGK